MKLKRHTIPLLIVLCSLFSVTCVTSQTTGIDDLDIAIRDASDYLNDNIPAKSKIVILNIQSDYNNLSEYIIDELIANAVNDKVFSVVDRAQLDAIRMELNFQLSGEVDDKSALEIGKFLGAQTIVSGAVSELADRHRMRIRALNVQTAEVQGQYNRNINTSRTIAALMRGGSYSGTSYGQVSAGGRTASGGTNRTNNTAQAEQARTQPTGVKNGIYTFWPRLRPTRAGLAVNDVFIPQITVTKDFIVIHFCRNSAGAWKDEEWNTGISGFYYAENFALQNLDNPSQFYSPVSALCTSNGMGRIWALSYKRFNATRLKFAGKQYDSNPQPFVFEEIILGEPDE
jgi:TolB-like protein